MPRIEFDALLKKVDFHAPRRGCVIGTVRGRDEIRGVVKGEHKVRVESRREGGVKLPAKYKDFETSGLKIKIPDAKNPIVLEVEAQGP